jgi:hypothetical protein
MKKTFILLIIALGLCSCVYDRVERIKIVNNSEEGQVIYHSCSDKIGTEKDSLNNLYYKQIAGSNISIYYETAYIGKTSTKWYGKFHSRKAIAHLCKDKQVRFFFISESVFMSTSWDTIVKYQMYNRKLVFSEEELRNNDWVVVYE